MATAGAALLMLIQNKVLRRPISDLRESAERLRLLILETHRRAGAGHLGSSLSIVEILTVLFARFLAVPGDGSADGDRLVLSKGHAALALYCQLMIEGRIDQAALASFGANGSALEPHPNEKLLPSVGASSGSLGQGLSIGIGLALGSRHRGRSDRCFVVIGDGETNEGQIWEAAQSAPRLEVGNLTAIVDKNGMQQDGPMADILPMPDIAAAWGAMGWETVACDGHDTAALEAALDALLAGDTKKPKLLVAATTKAYGVPFLEGQTESHYPAPLTADEMALVRYMALERRRRA